MDCKPTMKKLRQARRLTFVPRWSVVPTIRQQKVDQHAFSVARIADHLMESHEDKSVEFRLLVLRKCLEHDDDEAVYGDTPSPSKNGAYNPKHVDPEVVVMKVADVLEAVLFLYEEQHMGNKWVGKIIDELLVKLHDWWGVFPWEERSPKPLTSDLVRTYSTQFLNATHPAMEAHYDPIR